VGTWIGAAAVKWGFAKVYGPMDSPDVRDREELDLMTGTHYEDFKTDLARRRPDMEMWRG
jgi:hypothetical protein